MRPALYTRPNKPTFRPVKSRAERAAPEPVKIAAPVIVDRSTECHVTPPEIAARMVRFAGGANGKMTLEPSAGTGSILRALREAGHSQFEMTAIEQHPALADTARAHCPTIITRCFLEYADDARGRILFPRVIMNPPFRKVRQHINAAISLMGEDGHAEPAELVALVPITFQLEGAETLEELGPDTFPTARVNTKIIYWQTPTKEQTS